MLSKMYMIRVEQLSKRFGTTVALDNVSLEVSAGEIVGLLGPNGAGKTTMMRLLTGYLAPTSGRVSVAGVDVQEHPLEVRRPIGYLPETVPVYAEMTVASYLDFVAELRDLPPRQNASRIRTVMERAGVAEVSGRLIGHLSKGYRQRVGLAQALLHNPDILILDEPTVGLDPSQVVEIRQLIRELALEHTVILSSHILPEVSQICSQVVIIDRGHIVASGTQDDLERRLKGAESLYVEMKADKAAAAEALAALAGVHTVQPGDGGTDKVSFTVSSEVGRDVREDLFRMAASRNWPILELRPVSMSLEEVFSRLTRQEEAQS